MREKFNRFMQGRYGNDKFNQFLMMIALVSLVLSLFGLSVFYLIALLFMVYAYYRMFSKKFSARAGENQWYLQKEWKIRCFFDKQKRQLKDRKTNHIYKCPNCKQKIRVPKGRGKIEITCRKCGTKFVKNS